VAKTKVGMISFAHGHANSYLSGLLAIPDVEIIGIADPVASRVEGLTQRHNIPYFADYRDLLKTEVDAVVICSENVHHAEQTIAAANAAKHVLCEKPLGVSVDEMRRMVDAAKQNGVQLMTAFPCRYLPSVRQAKQAVERGDIGDIVAVKGTNRGSMPGKWFIDPALSGGGAVLDHTVHVMDLLNWFLGSKVTDVYAESGTLFHDIPVDDAGMVHVGFANGVIAVIDTSWSRSKSFPFWGDVTMEIIGTNGVISVDAFAQKNEIYSDEKSKAQWSYWGDGMDDLMVADFIQAVREGSDVPISGEDGLKSAQVALAAYDSIRQGKKVSING
jgi:predicted dehydrogenase